MGRTRSARRSRAHAKRKTVIIAVAASLVVAGAAVAAVLLLPSWGPQDEVTVEDQQLASELSLDAAQAYEVTPSTLATALVEVPDVTGRSLEEAELLLEVAGLSPVRVERDGLEAQPARPIVEQDPAGGARVPAGSEVRVTYVVMPDLSGAAGSYIVCVDPGHQLKADTSQEPIGPDSAKTKYKVSGGATGVQSKTPESEVVLAISLEVKERLEARGIVVVMTRTTQDVNVSNAERARIANQSKADLFVRVHADGSTDASVRGVTTLYPSGNAWVDPIETESLRAARAIHAAVVAATGAEDLGLSPRDDITGFNWSQVPAVLVEAGFLSNPTEDKLLNSTFYQDKVAEGIATGIIAYLEG